MKLNYRIASTLLAIILLEINIYAQDLESKSWAYSMIDIPQLKEIENTNNRPIIVAVIDDAFNLQHKELKGFIYSNSNEIVNQVDDDGNEFIDDIAGWDVSDDDNDVSFLKGREDFFYHGTYISSIITKVASIHYGKEAKNRIKILPVKVLSDQSNGTYLKDGYKGIKYAINAGADIICLAWSGGNPTIDEKRIIEEAYNKGILIISSAGNFNDKEILYPALLPHVMAVAGIDKDGNKYHYSNYGINVDISAPAVQVFGAHPEKANAYIFDEGTSASTALVAACAAVVLSKNSSLKNKGLKEILINSAMTYNPDFYKFNGNMGSGIVNLANALNYLSNINNFKYKNALLHAKGIINIDRNNSKEEIFLNPPGNFEGIFFESDKAKINKPKKYDIEFSIEDSIYLKMNLSELKTKLFIPSAKIKIKLKTNRFKKDDLFKLYYYAKAIDSTILYCQDTKFITAEKGSLGDGSGDNNYANLSACKWIIKVPAGKRIKFTFDKLDTQGGIDYVYLVDGKSVLRENLLAQFSGPDLPPIVYSKTNEVLIWFVTDKNTTGKGWHLHFEAFD